MANEPFLSRWLRRKVESQTTQTTQAKQPAAPATPAVTPTAQEQAGILPGSARAPEAPPVPDQVQPQPQPELKMEDVAGLTKDSDYSAFLARGVDENVKRSALKKLFSDPHFNVMDGLDIYIDDYSKFEPIPPAMLATLNHAKYLLDPLSQLEKPVLPVADQSRTPEEETRTTDNGQASADTEAAAVPETSDASDAVDAEPAPGQEDDMAPESAPKPKSTPESGADPTKHA